VGEILALRNLGDVEAVRAFLSPRLEDLHDPFLLPDIRPAAERLWRAVERGERILVHGDYDVDGVTAVALLVSAFRSLGVDILHSLPHRLEDGYGLSDRAVAEAKDRGVSVLVTVDCGISDHGAVDLARSLGIDTVVTDHHQPGETLPAALAVVAPSRSDAGRPDPELAGVGVAYKLLEAMARLKPDANLRPEEGLDLVALGTVADVAPLAGENRILVTHGLQRLTRPARPGLRALKEIVELGADSPVSSAQVAFRLAPRLNAAGRLGTAERAANLLLTDDEAFGLELAMELDEENRARRRKDQEALEEAVARIEAEGMARRRAIVLGSREWHPGVIGIVASRLVQRYHRPVVLVAFEGGRGKGSGRSIEGFDLATALDRCKEWLESYGGHEQAAGLAVTETAFEGFRGRLEEVAEETITPEMIQPVLKVDRIVRLDECGLDLLEWFRMLEPCGEGNRQPVLAALGGEVLEGPRLVGKGHLKMSLRQGSTVLDAIGFGMGDRIDEIRTATGIDVVFALGEDRWSGVPRVQLRLKDFRPSRETDRA